MPRRLLILIVLFGLSVIAAVAAAFWYVPLRGQFGGFFPVWPKVDSGIRDQICSSPSNPEFRYQISVSGPGCYADPFYQRICQPYYADSTCGGTVVGCSYQYHGLRECGYGLTTMMRDVRPDGTSGIALGYSCRDAICCNNGSYVDETLVSCADPQAECVYQEHGQGVIASGYYCQCKPGWTRVQYECVPDSSLYSSSAPPAPASCGNGIKETGEECDAGNNNVPIDVANKEWWDVDPLDVPVLTRSSCLNTCKIAQCSDGKDNDGKNGKDNQDIACYDGIFGNGPTYLKGYNKEDCPLCRKELSGDNTPPTTGQGEMFAAFIRKWVAAIIDQQDSDYPGIDQLYCKDDDATVQGNQCTCSEDWHICFASWEDTNDDGAKDTFVDCAEGGGGVCKKANLNWQWMHACKQGSLLWIQPLNGSTSSTYSYYRCALYSQYTSIDVGNTVNIYRYRKLINDGGNGCKTRWDCKSNYTINQTSIVAKSDSQATTQCLSASVTERNGTCCPLPEQPGVNNPNPKPPPPGCGRVKAWASGNNSLPGPFFCPTPSDGGLPGGIDGIGGDEDLGGQSGGGDTGGTSGDGGGGGVDGTGDRFLSSPAASSGRSSTASVSCKTVDQWLDCGTGCTQTYNACQTRCLGSSNYQGCLSACRNDWQNCTTGCGPVCAESSSSRPILTASSSSEGRYCCINNQCTTNSGIKGVECPLTKAQCAQSCGVSSRTSSSTSTSAPRCATDSDCGPSQEETSCTRVPGASGCFMVTEMRTPGCANGGCTYQLVRMTGLPCTCPASSSNQSGGSRGSVASQTSSRASSVSSLLSTSARSSSSPVSCAPRPDADPAMMRVVFTKVESTDPSFPVQPNIYVDGPNDHDPRAQIVSYPGGQWFPISRITPHPIEPGAVPGLTVVREEGGEPRIRFIAYPRGKQDGKQYATYEGMVEFLGRTPSRVYCNDPTQWYCPENESDGIAQAPDNDEIGIRDYIVHFSLYVKQVSNAEGNIDSFYVAFPPLPLCAVSSSSGRSVFSSVSLSSRISIASSRLSSSSVSSIRSSSSALSRTSSASSASTRSFSFSSSSMPGSGVCCEGGNVCNPFGTCSNPYLNYNSCLAACGQSSSASSQVFSSRTSVSSSRLSSAPSSSRSSSTRSSSSRSSQSTASSITYHCSGFECQLGGDTFCGSQNLGCITLNNNPCFVCAPQPGSSFGPIPSCNGTACIAGGASFCAQQNRFCLESAVQPCFTCSDQPFSGSTGSAPIAVRASSAYTPPILPPGVCECNPGEKCVAGNCLLPEMIVQLPAFCGNARVDPGEICDEGSFNSDQPNAACRPDCTPGRCGDGILDTPLELCDDGNTLNNDGCSSLCIPEHLANTIPPLAGQVIDLPFGGTQEPGAKSQGSVPAVTSSPSTADTGPATLAIMIAGGAAGWAWMRRRVRK